MIYNKIDKNRMTEEERVMRVAANRETSCTISYFSM